MKLTYRFLALAILAIGAAVFSSGLGAQQEGWQIVRADYGFKNQRNDVTDILKEFGGADELAVPGGVEQRRLGALAGDEFLHLGRFQRFRGLGVQPLDDRGRCFRP